jgi:hypothetical protein
MVNITKTNVGCDCTYIYKNNIYEWRVILYRIRLDQLRGSINRILLSLSKENVIMRHVSQTNLNLIKFIIVRLIGLKPID